MHVYDLGKLLIDFNWCKITQLSTLYEGLFSIYKLGSTEIFRPKKFNALHYLYMGT